MKVNVDELTCVQEEQVALEWIRTNPHQALVEAVRAHEGWKGCKCELDKLLQDPGFYRMYGIERRNK